MTRVVAFAALGLALVVGLGVAFLYANNPRDEAAFLRSVSNSWNDELRGFVKRTPEQVVSEGDRACAWLAEQEWAFPDLTGSADGDVTGVGLLTQFTQETRGQERLSFTEYGERMARYIGLTAWRDLCGVTFDLRHTHHPLG